MNVCVTVLVWKNHGLNSNFHSYKSNVCKNRWTKIHRINHIEQPVFRFVDVSLTGGKHGRISNVSPSPLTRTLYVCKYADKRGYLQFEYINQREWNVLSTN